MQPAETATTSPPATAPAAPAVPAGGPPPGPLARLATLPWPTLAFVALVVGTIVGALVYPTYPNYDSYYSLVWGREVLDGELPSFDGYRTPTQHPLAVAFGAVLSLIGQDADRVMVWCTLASFVVLCAGLYRLGKAAFTPLVGLTAAALLITRFDFPSLAARAYIDIPYLALIIWAAALELERPRRGGIVWGLIIAAGLLRPEAWILAGLYWLWLAWKASWADRIRTALIGITAPVVWVLSDWIVTGDPLFSQNHTSGLAEELGRTQGIDQIPSSMRQFFFNLAKAPVVYAGLLGVGLALWYAPRRLAMPVALWLAGTGTFVMVGLAGLSVIDRYLLVPALMTMLFGAVAISGWTMLRPGTLPRRIWMGVAVVSVVYGAVFTATKVNFEVFDRDLTLRGATHPSLVELLEQQPVRAGRACGPVTVPNHKLVPEVRWVLDAGADDVLARSDDASEQAKRRGVALYVTQRAALLRQALVEESDDPFDSIPMDGFLRVGFTDYYGAYVSCPEGGGG